jgi:four helix bundle protein
MENRRGETQTGWFPVERLDVFWVAVDFLRLCDRLGRRLWVRNSALCRQLQRAAASLIANIGEGAACHTAGDRRRYFEYAYRSAGECSALLLSFHALNALTLDEYQEARALLARVHMMLRKLMAHAHPRP